MKRKKTNEDKLKELVDLIFKEERPALDLRSDLALVRVLPKESILHCGIAMPDGHNKILYEGIVLQTGNPKLSPKFLENLASAPEVGDHVLFHHFEGIPVFDILDEKKYRLLTYDKLLCQVSYERLKTDAVLYNSLLDVATISTRTEIHETVAHLMKNFDIIPKNQRGLTTSGQ